MDKILRNAFNKEMDSAKKLYQQANYSACFHNLERAHILGQRYYLPHVKSHWWMLKVGYKQSSFREIIGQSVRIIASFASLLGWVPVGNTGGANVNALKPMLVPKDLQPYLQAEKNVSATKAIFKAAIAVLGAVFVVYALQT